MTLGRALELTDELKDNMMVQSTKIMFLSEIEGKIHREILMKHEHTAEEETKPVYTAETDLTTELLVPDDYAMVYIYFLMTKIDQMNQEEDKENNDRIRFENAWNELSDFWTREHMPLQLAGQLRL